MRYITDFGEIEANSQEEAERTAFMRWTEDGWKAGGYHPMTRAEFEQYRELKWERMNRSAAA